MLLIKMLNQHAVYTITIYIKSGLSPLKFEQHILS